MNTTNFKKNMNLVKNLFMALDSVYWILFTVNWSIFAVVYSSEAALFVKTSAAVISGVAIVMIAKAARKDEKVAQNVYEAFEKPAPHHEDEESEKKAA
jgi:hypothetical protein